MSCDKILQHDWTALYSAAGQGLYTQFTRPRPLLRKWVWLVRLGAVEFFKKYREKLRTFLVGVAIVVNFSGLHAFTACNTAMYLFDKLLEQLLQLFASLKNESKLCPGVQWWA